VNARQKGDGNPGAVNVFRSGNKSAGLLALILDVSKAAVKVGLPYYKIGIPGIHVYFIAVVTILRLGQ